MTFVSLGDLAQSLQLRRLNAELSSDLRRLSTELASGRRVDPLAGRAFDAGPLAALERSLSSLSAYGTVTREAGLIAEAAQAGLERIARDATEMIGNLLALQGVGNPSTVDSAGAEARQKFESVVSALNTSAAGRSVFAGQAFDGPAVAAPDVILADIAAAVVTAGATTAADVQAVVADWFAFGGGFETQSYLGADESADIRVSDGSTARPSRLATDPDLSGVLEGLATAALLDMGVLVASSDERRILADLAADRLLSGQGQLVDLQADLGRSQEQIASAEAANASEVSAYELTRAEILEADPFDTASQLAALEAQLESLYLVTGRLSALSLTNFLR